MTKIRLTNRKSYSQSGGTTTPSDSTCSSSADGSPNSLNNNNTPNGACNHAPSSTRSLYRPLTSHHSTNDEYIDSQFQKPPARVPIRSICLASFLCFAGLSLLAFGCLVMAGHLDGKFTDRVWPMVIMGALMFIPGAYHVRIAYYAYKGKPGYSFDDIPEFE